jgi:transposase
LSDIQATEVSRTVITGTETETKSPKQRRYTTAYKLRIIAMADACTNPGEVASLLRKEGLYSSTLADFRRQKLRGALDPKSDKPVAKGKHALQPQAVREIAALQRENRKLRRDIEIANRMLEIQKKVSEVLGISLITEE